jgi:hypothetical protein
MTGGYIAHLPALQPDLQPAILIGVRAQGTDQEGFYQLLTFTDDVDFSKKRAA